MNIINELAAKKSSEMSAQLDKWVKESLDRKIVGRMVNRAVEKKRLLLAKVLAKSVNLTIESQEGVDMEKNYRLIYRGEVIARKTIPIFDIIFT